MSLWDTFHNQYEKRRKITLKKNSSGRKNGRSTVTKQSLAAYSNRNNSSSSSWATALIPASTSRCIHTTPSDPRRRERNGNRDARRQLGERLAQRRAFSSQSFSSTSFRGNHDCFKDGSHVIYRRAEDWSTRQTYVNCIFLDEATVLAADMTGKVDVVRLPPYGYSEGGKPRVLGTPIASRLEALPSFKGSSTFQLQSIRKGRAFAVGMPSGACHIFSTERIGEDSNNHHLQSRSTCLYTQQQSSSPSFIQAAWSIQSPCRRYYRDYTDSQQTLSAIMAASSNGSLYQDDPHVLSAIPGWDASIPRVRELPNFFPRQRPANHASKWAFRETSPSSLLMAHVDLEHDCFSWLRISDSRTIQEPAVVCVDKSSRNTLDEYVTACVFLSDTCLATAHNYSNSSTSLIKLWDIRMLHTQRQESLETISLPQFPENPSIGLDPVATKYINVNNENDNHCTGTVITGLSGPSGAGNNTSKLSIALQPKYDDRQHPATSLVDHCVLDLGRLELSQLVRQYHANLEWNPVYATSGSQHYLACTGRGQTEEDSSILVYNIKDDSGKKRNHNRPTKFAGQKRSALLVNDNDDRECQKDNDTSKHYGSSLEKIKFDPILKDRHGLPTTLSCMEMNYDGTAILGGSIDGDLFLWRSP